MALWVTDRLGRMVWVNSDWQSLTEIEFRHIEGLHGQIIMHPDDVPIVIPLGTFAVMNLKPFSCHFRHRTEQGLWIPTLVTCEPIIENGVWRGYRGITQKVRESINVVRNWTSLVTAALHFIPFHL